MNLVKQLVSIARLLVFWNLFNPLAINGLNYV
ncbi:MAG: hypothetical protein K0Q55_2835 [Verrucomicrobia bacterium]|jgi:hypothetical protein|nr:hypothetical protein [Verrucomicrobiota bacterium]